MRIFRCSTEEVTAAMRLHIKFLRIPQADKNTQADRRDARRATLGSPSCGLESSRWRLVYTAILSASRSCRAADAGRTKQAAELAAELVDGRAVSRLRFDMAGFSFWPELLTNMSSRLSSLHDCNSEHVCSDPPPLSSSSSSSSACSFVDLRYPPAS